MCPYVCNGCKIQQRYANTNLCTTDYYECAAYMLAVTQGVNKMPEDMTALDYARLQITGGMNHG